MPYTKKKKVDLFTPVQAVITLFRDLIDCSFYSQNSIGLLRSLHDLLINDVVVYFSY